MDVDELFGLALERFIPERTALARSLRGEGRRDEAAEVAATRKPSVAAWAVNQLVRTQGRAVKELFAAGDALRAAQEQVVRGEGDGGGLRSAAERERAVVDELVAAARGLLSSEGHGLSEAVLTRVSDTLNAAALDEAAREQVREGRLERELRYVGFGGGLGAGGAPVGPTAKPRRQPAPKPPPHKTKTEAQGKAKAQTAKPDPGAKQRREQERRERQRAERERAAEVKAARTAEGETRRAAERARRALEVAEERRDKAAQALDQAELEVQQARAELDASGEAHRRAVSALERLRN